MRFSTGGVFGLAWKCSLGFARGRFLPLVLLLLPVLLLSACGGSGGGPGGTVGAGSLSVTVEGLTAGAVADIEISGPGGFSASVSESSVLADLVPGMYAVTARPVAGHLVVGRAVQEIEVAASKEAGVAVAYTAATPEQLGSLRITVQGLSGGSAGDVAVSGPASFSASVTESTTLENLLPGMYRITPRPITGHAVVGQAVQEVEVVASKQATVTVAYTAATSEQLGSLRIVVQGLNPGSVADVAVTGPASFSASISESTTLENLAPGKYTIIANGVAGHVVSGVPSEVQVVAGGEAETTVTYVHAGLTVSIGEASHNLLMDYWIELQFELERIGVFTGEVAYAVSNPAGFDIWPESGVVPAGSTSFHVTVTDDKVPLGEHPLVVTVSGSVNGETVTDMVEVNVVLAPVVTMGGDMPGKPMPGMLRTLVDDERTAGAVITFAPYLFENDVLVIRLEEQLNLTRDVTIAGPSGWSTNEGPRVILDGQGAVTPLVIYNGPDVTLANIQVRNGHGTAGEAQDGGGIKLYSGSSLTLDGTFVHGNRAARHGGGIWGTGMLTVRNDSRIFQNQAGQHGGGVWLNGSGAEASFEDSIVSQNTAGWRGGGLYLGRGTFELSNTRVLQNTAHEDGGGIFADNARPAILRILNGSEIAGNGAAVNGGGVHSYAEGTIEDSLIHGNEAGKSGGGIRNHLRMDISNSSISGNTAGERYGGVFNDGFMTITAGSVIEDNVAASDGGGVFNGYYASDTLGDGQPKEMRIEGSIIRNNRAGVNGGGNGGGIHSIRRLTVIDSHITGNSATNANNDTGKGGGIFSVSIPHTGAPANNGGELYVSGTTISDNNAQQSGGGIYSGTEFSGNLHDPPNAPLTLINSTIAENTAIWGGGMLLGGFNDGDVKLFFNTVARNQASGTGGQGGGVSNAREHVTIRGNIFAHNSSTMNGTDRDFWPSMNRVQSEGYNFFTITPHSDVQLILTDIRPPDVKVNLLQLQSLADNGGSTPTIALAGSSTARRSVPVAGCVKPDGAPLELDQRGMTRPVDGRCSMGAYERQ